MTHKEARLEGGSCRYLGKDYPLIVQIVRDKRKAEISYDGSEFLCQMSVLEASQIEAAIKAFYKKQCRKIIDERLRRYQPMIRIKYRSVTINERSKQWGTCSGDRQLTFNWRLVLYPMEAIDYVVVHELCHLKHLNHDRSFWRLLGKIYPDYKRAVAYLQE